eukprot:jgi/Botrbrau1/15171/Bobra.0149s0036.1
MQVKPKCVQGVADMHLPDGMKTLRMPKLHNHYKDPPALQQLRFGLNHNNLKELGCSTKRDKLMDTHTHAVQLSPVFPLITSLLLH